MTGSADGQAEQPPALVPPQQHGLALLACACLLLAAFTNCSLTGLVFLAAFGVWGAVCAAHNSLRSGGGGDSGDPLHHRVAAGLWSVVAALAGIVLTAQVLTWRVTQCLLVPHIDAVGLE